MKFPDEKTENLQTQFGKKSDLAEVLPCPGNWTVVTQFITSYNPHYFETRMWIISELFTLAVTGLVSNIMVILYLLHKQSNVRKSAGNLLAMQLALADGSVCLFCLLADAIWNVTVEWTGGLDLCRFVKFMQMFSLYSSTMILTGMTVERCITMTYPLTRSRPELAMCRAKFISVTVWSLSALCSVPQATIFHLERAPICADFYQCVTFGAYSEPWQEKAYTMTTLCILFLMPLIIMIACYLTIFTKISREAKMALGTQRRDRSNQCGSKLIDHVPENGYGRQLYRMTRQFSLWHTFIIGIVFFCCWAPYYTAMTAHMFDYPISHGWMTFIFSFGMASTVLNPLAYGVFKVMNHKATTTERHNRNNP